MTDQEEDARLVADLRQGLQGRVLKMHVSYRKARRDAGFTAALTARIGARAVWIRDRFLFMSLVILVGWFAVAEAFDMNEHTVRLFGTDVETGTALFFVVLGGLVLAGRRWVRPLQGAMMHDLVTADADLFRRLWQGGAVAIYAPAGENMVCQSPRDDWRQFIRHQRIGG